MKTIKVIFKQFDKKLPKPEYKTPGAAALDLYARLETSILAGEVGYVPLNIALQLPENHWALIAARSSLHKRGLMMANGIGVGDYDYRGPNDEYRAALFNFSSQDVVVEKGERIVQLIVMHREPVELQTVSDFNTKDPKTKDRGGFGSTGRK
jgi:dUTP pyrophosphatase